MAVAKLYPEPATLRRKGSSPVGNTERIVSGEYISHARTVLAVLPQAADAVLAGSRGVRRILETLPDSDELSRRREFSNLKTLPEWKILRDSMHRDRR